MVAVVIRKTSLRRMIRLCMTQVEGTEYHAGRAPPSHLEDELSTILTSSGSEVNVTAVQSTCCLFWRAPAPGIAIIDYNQRLRQKQKQHPKGGLCGRYGTPAFFGT